MKFDWKQRRADLIAFIRQRAIELRHWRPSARLRKASRTATRYAVYTGTALLSLLAIAFTVARFTLPAIAERKADAEAYLSRATGQTVRIGALVAQWDGLFPGLRVEQLAVLAPERAAPVVTLDQVRANISWCSCSRDSRSSGWRMESSA